MITGVTTNPEQRLFVIPAGNGYSCFGFDNCFRDAKAISEKLGRPDLAPTQEEIGTLGQYEQYRNLLAIAAKQGGFKETWFTPGTPEGVCRVLEAARTNGRRIRIYCGDRETGQSWLEEHDVIGTIGRSTGIMKVPLLIQTTRSMGGMAILTDCIVRIQDADSKRDLYRHASFHVPPMQIVNSDIAGYAAAVLVGGSVHARFKKRSQAESWVSFMKGERMRAW